MLRGLSVVKIGSSLYPLEIPLAMSYGGQGFEVAFIDGLSPVQAESSTSPYAQANGEHWQGSRVGMRNIVLTLDLIPDYYTEGSRDVEDIRRRLYRHFAPQSQLELKFETDRQDFKLVTKGYVESFEAPLFSQVPQVQISILCPSPYFERETETEIIFSASNGASSPVEFFGDVPVGFQIAVKAAGAFNTIMVESDFGGGGYFLAGDLPGPLGVVIDSRFLNRSIVDLYQGTNYLMKVETASKWLVGGPGLGWVNVLTNAAESYENEITIRYRERYVGL